MIQDAFLLPFLNLNLISQKLDPKLDICEAHSENSHLILIFPKLKLNIVCIPDSTPTCHASVVTRQDLGAESGPSINLVTRRGMILP